MNWTEIIQSLIDKGKTQAWIAEQCGTGQSHISQLYRGERKQPNWELGNRLIRLSRRVCGRGIDSTVDCEKQSISSADKEAS